MGSQLDDRPLAVVQDALRTLGFDPQGIVADYDFAVPGIGSALGRVDLAAFSDPVRHDLHTSCIAAQRVTHDADIRAELGRLSYLAAPLALILQPERVDIWPVTRESSSQCIDSVSYDRLHLYFSEHDRDFHPDVLTAAKTTSRQPSFFDLDRTLLDFAYEATQNILVDRFEDAVGAAKNTLGDKKEAGSSGLTKAALQILAAAILEDKQLLEQGRSNTVEELIQRSSRQYGQYFDEASLNLIGSNTAQVMFEALRQNVTFRSFTNEMIGYFYENAFVNEKLRRELGIYYTPRSIAKRILTRLPVEDIPPSERVAFDGSSGSGNLLLAAFERISALLPARWTRNQKHAYLVKRVHGVDLDPFATQVASLSLFFIDFPAGDAWNVRTADFLESKSLDLPRPPTIFVGNPPFKETRSSEEGHRLQRATKFLTKYLDMLQHGGLLGIVLPETFLENSSCRDVRRRLLEECEILELWHLPEGMFPMSNVATVVITAKKSEAARSNLMTPLRVERVGVIPNEQKRFLKGERPRLSHVVPSTMQWIEEPSVRIFTSPLERSLWDSIPIHRRLKDVASIRNGIIPGEKQRATHLSYSGPSSNWKPWLGGTTGFEPFALKPRSPIYIRYPGNLHRPRPDLERVFETPYSKVLVNSGRAPGNPWRIYAAIDDFGYFPSHSIYCIMPDDKSVSLEELVAVLNSSIANAWVDSRNRRRWIERGTLGDIPFPVFANGKREEVIGRVQEIMALKKQVLEASPRHQQYAIKIRELVLSLDELIYEALGIVDEGRNMLTKIFAGHTRPGIEWNGYHQPIEETRANSDDRKWPVTGQVLQINAEENSITVWVRGFNGSEPIQLPIPEAMPGWALRPDATFEAEVSWDTRDSGQLGPNDITNFRPLDFSYSETEELLEVLKNPHKLYELYGC